MKKYRLEIAIGLIFFTLLVGLLWGNLENRFVWLPYALLSVGVLGILGVVIPWPERDENGTLKSEPGERYAPRYFGQSLLASVVGISLLVGLATLLNRERFSRSFDLTKNKINSLSEETITFLGGINENVSIFCIPSLDARENYCAENLYLREFYSQKSSKIKHMTVNLGDMATLQKVAPAGYSRLVLLTDGNKRSEITGQITESKLTNGLVNLIKTKKVVYFLVGSGEPATGVEGERSYAVATEILKNRAYEVKEHAITDGPLPADAQMLVVGSAEVAYSAVVEGLLRSFLARGGRLILTVNPFRPLGLHKLMGDLGLSLGEQTLVGNGGATQLGAQLAQLDPMRPPLVLSEFSRETPMTNVFSARDVALAEGAREIHFNEPKGIPGLKIKATKLVSAQDAAPVTLTDEQRVKIPATGAHNLKPDAGYEPRKKWNVGYLLEVEGASLLGSPGAAGAKASESKTQIVVWGFPLAGKYDRVAPANAQILPLAVSHLYQDKDLVSIPNKDFAPRQFKTERNPGGYLFLFAGLLPLATALTGFYIGLRRRAA